MALPEFVAIRCKRLLDEYCERKVPPHARHQVRLVHEARGNSLTLLEMRAPWDGSDRPWTKLPIARFRFDPETGDWELRCFDRNAKSHLFEPMASTKRFDALLEEVERDRTGIFWG